MKRFLSRSVLFSCVSLCLAPTLAAEETPLRGRMAFDVLARETGLSIDPIYAIGVLALLLVSAVVFIAREVREERKDARSLLASKRGPAAPSRPINP